ncbi:Multi-glycosylated core protein 24 (MGC-24), sialomucin [Popillia japonica]|uniref:Multi-glycosylated core protein 24 (MGC-24), sialomucin n=1 Tax=Popillia japonica TaxID=7064 RepID=A0AAW1JH68_POPJA
MKVLNIRFCFILVVALISTVRCEDLEKPDAKVSDDANATVDIVINSSTDNPADDQVSTVPDVPPPPSNITTVAPPTTPPSNTTTVPTPTTKPRRLHHLQLHRLIRQRCLRLQLNQPNQNLLNLQQNLQQNLLNLQQNLLNLQQNLLNLQRNLLNLQQNRRQPPLLLHPEPTTKPTEPTTKPTEPTTKPTPTTATTTSVPPTTVKPVDPTTTPVPPKDRHFDGASFIGGIILAVGLMGIGFIAFKFYKARTERNYHTL